MSNLNYKEAMARLKNHQCFDLKAKASIEYLYSKNNYCGLIYKEGIDDTVQATTGRDIDEFEGIYSKRFCDKLAKEWDFLIYHPQKERTIKLICTSCPDVENEYYKTTAPKFIIDRAIAFQNEYRRDFEDWDNDFNCDQEILEAYVQALGYDFESVTYYQEVYTW